MGRVFKALNKISSQEEEIAATLSAPGTGEKNDSADSFATEDMTAAAELFRASRPSPEPEGATEAAEAKAAEKADFLGQPEELQAQKWHERLVAASETASLVSEEFRRLRTHILHPPDNREPARTILIVSASPEEGKSLVCAGLGLALAQGVEEYALLIDCDLRRPSLAGLFGLSSSQGLVDHLQKGVALNRLIRKTGFRKLSVIPSGRPPYNPAELLGSERLTAMIQEVANRYPDRFVLFDSPPLQNAAETAILAKQVDGVILVVREGKSRREDVKELVETIGTEKIIGLVYNGYQMNLLESKMAGQYYYKYYGEKK